MREASALVLAHGSGIDDVLWFLVPAALAMFVVRRAERRAARKASESADPPGSGSDDPSG